MTANFPRKAAFGSKTPSLLLAFLVTFVICACEFENPWMKDVLQEKTISFNTNGGSSVPNQILYAGQRVKRPTDPSKTDNVFQGWYKDNVTFEQPYDFSFVPRQDMTLYACWDNQKITITFDADGGTPVPPKQILYKGEKVQRPQNDPKRSATTLTGFVDWYTDIYYYIWDYDNDKISEESVVISADARVEISSSGEYNYIVLYMDENKSKRYDFDFVPLHDMVLHAGYKTER
jgi:uncharacterized repeat protein (TIGR02543 family)